MAKSKRTSALTEELRKAGAKGGKARAARLTAGERKAIAQDAAAARWSGHQTAVPRAEFGSLDHPLKIGDVEIPCYVLEDGRRVLTQRGLQTGIGMSTSGGSSGAHRMARFVASLQAKGLDLKDLSLRTQKPILFRPPGTQRIGYGYEATILPDLCEAVLDAKKQGFLLPQQERFAEQCEILIRGLARTGIIALVDEATGYQEIRDRQALQAILNKYLTDEWAKWTKTFPDEFYKELFRLKEIEYPGNGQNKPSYVGHWTNRIVYSRLAPGVKKELQKKNPRLESGHRRHKHHQHLTRDYGHPALKAHLSNVIFLMKTCEDWDDFEYRLDRAAPKFGDTIPLALEAPAKGG